MTNDIKEYAILDNNNLVVNVVVFSLETTDSDANIFAVGTGFAKAISCSEFGKPYIGDTWDNTNKVWVEDQSLRIPLEPIVEEPTE